MASTGTKIWCNRGHWYQSMVHYLIITGVSMGMPKHT